MSRAMSREAFPATSRDKRRTGRAINAQTPARGSGMRPKPEIAARSDEPIPVGPPDVPASRPMLPAAKPESPSFRSEPWT